MLANDCSSRGAVVKANDDTAADTIILPAGTYELSIPWLLTPECGGGVTLEDVTANSNCEVTGDLDVLQPLALVGAGLG